MVTIWRWTKDGNFPPSYKLNPNGNGISDPIGWRESDVENWINNRPTGLNVGIPGAWAARSHNAMLRRTSGPTPIFGFRRGD
jgi:hypothetical protein